ncbi:MAG: HD-GYP domain-containing protein [Candidatus Wenzhouxiangella sp. M2_3B_020]
MRNWLHSPQNRIVAIYLVVAALWIYFSDRLIQVLFRTPDAITAAQNVKGWFFVAFTALLLYLLVRDHFRSLERKHAELIDSYDETIRGWIQVMDKRHRETRHHTERVSRMAVAFAEEAGIGDRDELVRIRRGAMLHDIGKIGIPDSVLTKPGKLDEDEWRIIRRHPEIGAEILSRIGHLHGCVDIPFCHHERWDGTGYPRGISADRIPLSARLFAIVDVWDALVHDRVYKNAWPEDEVLAHIREQAGKHFDPRLAELFVRRFERIRSRAGLSDLADDSSQNP